MKPRILLLLLVATLAITAACAKKDAGSGDTVVVPADTSARVAPHADTVRDSLKVDTTARE
jgi:hypothetical protein